MKQDEHKNREKHSSQSLIAAAVVEPAKLNRDNELISTMGSHVREADISSHEVGGGVIVGER